MYIPFNIKTDYSLMYSMIKIKDLVKYAVDNNLKALTLTDDNLFGAMEFYLECTKNNIKPIIGINIKLNDLDVILYAMNYDGYVSLLKLSTLYRENKLEKLNDFKDNILCILPYESRKLYNELKEIYSEIYVSYKNDIEKNKIKLTNKLYMDEILYLKNEEKNTYKYFRSYKKELEEKEYDNYLKLDIEDNSYMYDKFNLVMKKEKDLLPNIENNYQVLKEECKKGLKKRFGNVVGSKYIERLKLELETINKMGFNNYFLIVSDYVKFAKENNILVGPGRGSAVGSLVAYTLEITNIDPLKYDLLFERFLNEKRITMPDIDIDFDASRREEVINYCIQKYGIHNVAGVITFATLGLKQAIKDLGPLFNIENSDISYLLNNLDNINNLNNNLKELLNTAKQLEGLKTNLSVNASGIVICKNDLTNYVPLEPHNNMYITGFTMNYLEDVGLLKMDFLALKNLTTISNIINEVKIDINNIPLNDRETLNIFNNNTLGIFQFDTEAMKDTLHKFKITSFDDIYNLSALARPGAKESIETFSKRKDLKEQIDYIDQSLINILKPTYGIIVYQEQIMKIANLMANYTLGEADILRRAMSKKKEDILINEKQKFITRSIENGYSNETATKIYDYILKFAEYGFNKSHSVAYALISYQMAYLKAHYKEYFMKNLLENSPLNNVREYINECKNNNVKLINPNINLSTNSYVINNGIILPFTIIKNINIGIINNILENRKEPYKDLIDFLIKVDTKLINKDIVLTLIKAGCFDSFDTRKTLIENLYIIFNYIDVYKSLGSEGAIKPSITKYEEYVKKELTNMEYEVYNFYINNNPIEEYRKQLNRNKTLSTIGSYMNRRIEVIVSIDSIKEITTKNNEKMCFIKISDTYTVTEAVVFAEVYKDIPKLDNNDIILMACKVARRNGKDQLIVNELKIIEKYQQ